MTTQEAKRLEGLWAGDFGDAYIERNEGSGGERARFWRHLLEKHPVGRVLEIGCNVGGNLEWIAKAVPPREVYGIDISETALSKLRTKLPTINALWSPARQLPFRDMWFDLVFTAGVLIHQPDATLPVVMAEAVRCSRRYVLALEYFAEERQEVHYRGNEGALFKRDYGRLYMESFPELALVERGFLGKSEGWDDVTYWLFEKGRTDGG